MEAVLSIIALLVLGVIGSIIFVGLFADEIVKVIRALKQK
jgi:hypothetical protein